PPRPRLVVSDSAFGTEPVDMDLTVLLGKPPRMTREARHVRRELPPFDARHIDLADALFRVLQLPAVADKTFLVTIGDRTVGGLSARDPMVGPWQVPVADVAATLRDFEGYAGEAMAIGERTPLALIDAPASGRMAIGEAITNIAAAAIGRLGEVRLSANWMAPAGHPGEDAALHDTVRSVALELCPALGVSIPVGKDSMSMRTAWREGEIDKAVTAPVSLIVSAFAAIADARRVLTPQLHADTASVLLLVDLGNGQNRLGGSALAQVYGQLGDVAPDVGDAGALAAFFATVQHLHAQDKLLAYHDRSDGGLLATLAEMAFAGRCGLSIVIDELPGLAVEALFNEELGAVLQVRAADRHDIVAAFEAAGLRCICVGEPTSDDRIRVAREGETLFEASRVEMHRAWSATTHALQRMRDNPESADQEYERITDADDPGLSPMLSFAPGEDIAAPHIATGVRPRIAILREQGVNGQVEMAAAFDRAGFAAYDVHMTDIISGRTTLAGFTGLAAGGGFSYGDVLGAGEGWAKSILFNSRASDAFAAFFGRGDTFALGVCNGCQMMSNLHELIPGSEHWPHFVRNRSEQFEARLVLLEVQPSPSIFFSGMQGSRIPVALAHGEGYAEFRDAAQLAAAAALVTLRFVDNRGAVTERYPYNPNGSPQGITGLTTPDGRVSILMPHPERVFRSVQMSWHPPGWGEDSPWMRMFRNARRWIG
ncbi:MAG: phosphoribosylformylglycinamidine synthase, partial [Casimicrobiaceae bacterium]